MKDDAGAHQAPGIHGGFLVFELVKYTKTWNVLSEAKWTHVILATEFLGLGSLIRGAWALLLV